MIKEICEEFKDLGINFVKFLKWLGLSILTACIVGGISTLFAHAMEFVTKLRTENFWILYTLPVGGLIIAGLYRLFDSQGLKRGTNTVISSIHSDEEVPLTMAPIIFISTIISHLCGASVGREGAALQLGGSIAHSLGKAFKLDESDKKVITMSGMSAAFAALFGTPMAAAVFTIEVIQIGVVYYAALVPCMFSAIIASQFAAGMGIHPESFTILAVPELTIVSVLQTTLIAIIVSAVSIIFCSAMHASSHLFAKYFKNPYVRVVVGAAIIIALTLLLGTSDYMGAGIPIINNAMNEQVVPAAFLLKILFTALAIGCGFKGGEIVPSFFVGATLGCLVGQLIGFAPSCAAAIGMVGMFCCVTNCPLTSTLIAFELFGYKAVPFFLIMNSIGYLLSGHSSLFIDQMSSLSKFKLPPISHR